MPKIIEKKELIRLIRIAVDGDEVTVGDFDTQEDAEYTACKIHGQQGYTYSTTWYIVRYLKIVTRDE